MSEKIIHPLDILLNIPSISKKTRNRICNLSAEEISALCDFKPKGEHLLPYYAKELQMLLSKMEVSKKLNNFLGRPPFMGRPYIINELAMAISNLYCLRCLDDKGIAKLPTSSLRVFLLEDADQELFVKNTLNEQDTGSAVTIRSAIHVMESYRDELITPPHRKSSQLAEDMELLVDQLEAPSFIHYNDAPHLSSVLDWLIATKPILDKNQHKLGWTYLVKVSDDWHRLNTDDEYYGNNVSEFPCWSCLVDECQDAWLAVFPKNNPYKLIPLTTPEQLWGESKAMDHCVYTYMESCIAGGTRIFSVRDASNGLRFATAEMSFHGDRWKLVQLKGKSNQELIHLLENSTDHLTIALNVLVNLYNKIDEVNN